MTHTHPEALEYAEHEAELVAAGNALDCTTCGGTGRTLHQPPAVEHRVYGTCPDCNGTGKQRP